MKRLIEEANPALSTLRELLGSVQPFQPNPFSKRLVHSRLVRVLDGEGGQRGLWLRPLVLGATGVFVAASAAAAGYGFLSRPAPAPERAAAPVVAAAPVPVRVAPKQPVAEPEPAPQEAAVDRAPEKVETRRSAAPLRSGEDPAQVTEAVRALRKQGDPARAQALLDRYLSSNPRGALSEDALALAIEAAAARKDPRAADYARRYLARYPSGRFRAVAERALAR